MVDNYYQLDIRYFRTTQVGENPENEVDHPSDYWKISSSQTGAVDLSRIPLRVYFVIPSLELVGAFVHRDAGMVCFR